MNRTASFDCFRKTVITDGDRTSLVDHNGIDSLSYTTWESLETAPNRKETSEK